MTATIGTVYVIKVCDKTHVGYRMKSSVISTLPCMHVCLDADMSMRADEDCSALRTSDCVVFLKPGSRA